MIPLMQRIQTSRFLDLGIPGGYEQYNYKDARIVAAKYAQIQKELKNKMAKGLQSMIKTGKESLDNQAHERELDDIFDVSDDSDEGHDGTQGNDQDEDSAREARRKNFKRGNTFNAYFEEDSDDLGYETHRKNNVEEDVKIAESIIQGIAEYTEFKV